MHELTGGNSSIVVRRGFSIVELLVVIGVIVILAGITVSAVLKAKGSADVAKLRSDLMAVASALDQYANDFKGVYPSSGVDRNGKPIADHVLAKALVGPGDEKEDGLEGPGFRVMAGGRAYQPYLSPDKFKTRFIKDKNKWELCDSFGTPIAYLPKRNTSIRPDIGPVCIIAPDVRKPIYNGIDANELPDGDLDGKTASYVEGQRLEKLIKMLSADLGVDNANSRVEKGGTLRFSGPFILISAGPDRYFVTNADDKKKSDNIYNFDR